MEVRKLILLFSGFALVIAGIVPAWAENIDPLNAGSQYAYGENIGWLNAEPGGDEGYGVEVLGNNLTGWLWAENIGWVSLSCENTGSCAAADYGVQNDGIGNLTGYAWSENAGWISFSCANTASCDVADYGVEINLETGKFTGQGWGENIGWINFDYAGFENAVFSYIETDWRMNGDISSNGMVTLDDAIMTLQIGAGIEPENSVYLGADVNGDRRIGLEEANYILQNVSGMRME
jgi:hypothetical protein